MTSPERPLSASVASPTARDDQSPPAITLGTCGHPLDPWETHVAHHPGCGYELCLEDRCDCPEACPDCCRACGYDLAERMGS